MILIFVSLISIFNLIIIDLASLARLSLHIMISILIIHICIRLSAWAVYPLRYLLILTKYIICFYHVRLYILFEFLWSQSHFMLQKIFLYDFIVWGFRCCNMVIINKSVRNRSRILSIFIFLRWYYILVALLMVYLR